MTSSLFRIYTHTHTTIKMTVLHQRWRGNLRSQFIPAFHKTVTGFETKKSNLALAASSGAWCFNSNMTKTETTAKKSLAVHFGGSPSSFCGQNWNSCFNVASSARMLGKNQIRFPSNIHPAPKAKALTVKKRKEKNYKMHQLPITTWNWKIVNPNSDIWLVCMYLCGMALPLECNAWGV